MDKKINGFSTVEIVIAIVVVVLFSAGGWYVWTKQQAKPSQSTTSKAKADTATKQDQVDSVEQQDTQPQQSVSDDTPAVIEELDIAVELTADTKDLVSKLKDDRTAYFSLKGFVDEANAKGYPYEINGNKGDCTEVAGVQVYKDQASVEAIENQVYGELLDNEGRPVSKEIVDLKDGRYALVFGSQSSCGRHSSPGDQYQALADREGQVRQTLLNLLQTKLYAKRS